ncbi:MerR family transcriptional regulator [Brachybacterium phenoliresistens]|uniref:MerR family transcriptional regulator n=1 Tax=Brachybacterium phenoliresistens TaxID=396014 RepID=Z9JUT0_9MICO|nr:MerR family transcriptional regulator [Brachybacterium phenoliresistens]EWS82130.1 MerR family transcriptional regulator [Brachybacterium phenoliresistens]
MSLPIGEVSRRSGLSPETLRYYEREGLLPIPPRTSGGARRYDPAVLDQLHVITCLRSVGFGLDQVRGLLASKESNSSVRTRIDAARTSLDRLDAELSEKEKALQEARDLIAGWRAELDSGEPWHDAPLPG